MAIMTTLSFVSFTRQNRGMNMAHLDALRFRLSNERVRLANAKSDKEREVRQVWVAGIEREIAQEIKFLGKQETDQCELNDDELLLALGL
jgi:phage host-nuclease inhibitor protein Gam